VADAVDPAVADMADPGPLGAQEQRCAGGAGALEFAVGLPEGVDAGVGLDEGLAQSEGGALLGQFEVDVRHDLDGLFAGLLGDRVSAHAVRDEEQVASTAPLLFIGGDLDRVVVLVMAAPDAYVSQAGMLDLIEANHRTSPRGVRS